MNMAVLHSHLFASPRRPFYLLNSASPPICSGLAKIKPRVCTADELHYVPLSSSHGNLALWRYLPSPSCQPKNHPLLLLSGLGTTAVGFDLSPESSARFMSGHGFDIWILEYRGAGLSSLEMETSEAGKIRIETVSEPKKSMSKLLDSLIHLSERLSGLVEGENSVAAIQIKDFTRRFVNIIEEGQQSGTPQFFDFLDQLSSVLDDFLRQLDSLLKYDWDFDHHLEEDLPTAMDYIRAESRPKDGKLLAVGHSMGGILLYAMLSRCGFEGRDSGLTAVATLGSSLDFRPSKSFFKLLLPLAGPLEALNIPVIPCATVAAVARPYESNPPNVLPWLNFPISAPGMMHAKLFEKLVAENYCTIPVKVVMQLKSVLEDGGLRNRERTFSYKEHLQKITLPVLAIAADQDIVCPPEAVYETVKMIPKNLVTYRVFGEPKGPHYAHYDLVGSHVAQSQVHPCIIDFLNQHDVYFKFPQKRTGY